MALLPVISSFPDASTAILFGISPLDPVSITRIALLQVQVSISNSLLVRIYCQYTCVGGVLIANVLRFTEYGWSANANGVLWSCQLAAWSAS